MNNSHIRSWVIFVLAGASIIHGERVVAISPATIAEGRRVFEHEWLAEDASRGGDGLGPLFNGRSCVACHHQGGVGGGGDSRFNAKTIGIESLRISGPVNNEVIAKMVAAFHPGFVQSDGSVVNTLTLPHHGGSKAFQRVNAQIMGHVPAEFSQSGGSTEPSEVRQSNATPMQFKRKISQNEILIQARLYQRNTTSLFGAGLVDSVDSKHIKAQVKAQERHREISGRPATLEDGRIGRFGWRANVASLLQFVDQACANEVGLETRRKPQGRDPMNPTYRNSGSDISDDQIRAMKDFIAALPAPSREFPIDHEERLTVARGEKIFASIGCAICHVPDLGPVSGLYSDLLLHEMGPESIDLNHAEPYIIRRTPVQDITFTRVKTTVPPSGSMGAYYGATTVIESTDLSAGRTIGSTASGRRRGGYYGRRSQMSFSGSVSNDYVFEAPEQPYRRLNIIDRDAQKIVSDFGYSEDDAGGSTQTEESFTIVSYVRLHYQPTKFNEEWRTPPLWGLRDSAPYMHDGRAETVLEAISMHDGEALGTLDRFLKLPLADRNAVLAFLETLVAPSNVPQPSL